MELYWIFSTRKSRWLDYFSILAIYDKEDSPNSVYYFAKVVSKFSPKLIFLAQLVKLHLSSSLILLFLWLSANSIMEEMYIFG